jgi:hypothetical protein
MTKKEWRAKAHARDRETADLKAACEFLARKLAELAEGMTTLTRTLTKVLEEQRGRCPNKDAPKLTVH